MKMLFIVTSLFLLSCNKDNKQPNEPAPDCNCNRVIQKTKFNTNGIYFGTYILINDCTGIQYNGEWDTANGDSEPIAGECYKN